MDIASIPFNRSIGITVDGSEVVLTPRLEHVNHVETVHATVVYGVAEAASGQCLLERFPDLTDSHLAMLRSSSVKYRRPASIDGDIRGVGTVSDDTVAAFRAALESHGRASIEIAVSVTQVGIELFTGSFFWFAGRIFSNTIQE